MDEREAMDRLRGADPAAGRTPDEERLAHLVEARRSAAGEAQAGGESAGAVDENAQVGDEHARAGDEHARSGGEYARSGGEHAPAGDELAARRSRRLLPVAAAAVVALAVGGAGYAVGRSVDDPPPNAEPTVGRVLDGTGMATAVPEIGLPGIGYLGGGRTSFTSSGLSSEGGTAAVWAFDAAGAYGEETAARAAEVLGLAGEPRQEEGGPGWSVGSNDGSTAFLHLMADGMTSVSYYDPALHSFIDEGPVMPLPAPDGQVEPGSAPRGGGTDSSQGAESTVEILPAEPETLPLDPSGPDEPDQAPDSAPADAEAPDAEIPPADGDGPDVGVPPADGDAPTADDDAPDDDVPATEPSDTEPADPAPTDEAPTAVEPDGAAPDGPAGVLYETLAALGIDPEAVEYETSDHWASDQVSLVTAHLVVDGDRAGATWQAEVVEDTVYSFNGPLAPRVELGEYDVVGPAQAVERLSDPRFGHVDYRMEAWTGPVPELSTLRPWGSPPAAPPEPGTAVPWPVRDVTITGAELTFTMTTTEDGVTLLVPAYSLSDSDGGTWTVMALAEHELAF